MFFSPTHLKPAHEGVSESTLDPAFIGCAKILLPDVAGRSVDGVLYDACPIFKREGRPAGCVSIVVSSGLMGHDGVAARYVN